MNAAERAQRWLMAVIVALATAAAGCTPGSRGSFGGGTTPFVSVTPATLDVRIVPGGEVVVDLAILCYDDADPPKGYTVQTQWLPFLPEPLQVLRTNGGVTASLPSGRAVSCTQPVSNNAFLFSAEGVAVFRAAADEQVGSVRQFTLEASGGPLDDTDVVMFTVTVFPATGMQSLTIGTFGSGRVASVPAGISCPGSCVAVFETGRAVTLTATADAGANFLSWSGACAGNAPSTTVVLDAAKACSAAFTLAPGANTVPLTVAVEGQGRLTSVPAGIDCPGACTINIARDTPPRTVTLTPTPAAGHRFYAWRGDPDCGNGALSMSAARSCTAVFMPVLAPYPDGLGWTVLGAPLTLASEVDPAPSLARDGNHPVVAYVEALAGDVARLYVKRLEGTSFVALGGGALNAGSITAASEPSLVSTNNGQPFVAWIQGNGIQQNVFVARFNGTAWESVGPPGIPLNYVAGSKASRPALALDAENRPLVAWLENGAVKLKRFDGTSWVAAAGGEGPVGATGDQLRMTTDLDGVPVLAWRQPVGGGAQLKVVRGLAFEPLGTSINAPGTPMTFFDVKADVGGAIAVTSEAATPVTVRRQRWDGSAWVTVAGPIVSNDPRPLQSLVLVRGFGAEAVFSQADAANDSAFMTMPGVTTPLGSSYARRLRSLSAVVPRADSPIVAATQSPTEGRHELRVWRFYP